MTKLFRSAALVAVCVAVAACGSKPKSGDSAEAGGKLRLGISSYSGYGPYFVGKEKGFFKDAGVEVDPQIVGDDALQRATAVRAGKLDGFTTTTDTVVNAIGKGIPLVNVLATDTSAGADGVVSGKSVADVKALKGQTIAVQPGTTTQFLLATALKKNGLSLDDIEQRNLAPSDAGAAFAAGKVKVAATWEPWLTRASERGGKVLASSKSYPGVLSDSVALSPSYVKEHPKAVRALVAGWDRSVKFVRENPDEAIPIMAEGLSIKPDDLREQLKTIDLFTAADSKKYMGTAQAPGQMFDVVRSSSEFWRSLGETKSEVDPDDAIDTRFVNNAK